MPIVAKGSTIQRSRTGSTGVTVKWSDAAIEFTKRVSFTSVYGDTGTGRTSFALSAPGPIALLHTAEKIDGIVERFAAQKLVRCVNFAGVFDGNTLDEVARQAEVNWDMLVAAWSDAFSWAKTIILDTDTEAWELLRYARFGGLKPDGGRVDYNYGPVNAEWKNMFKRFKLQEATNVVVIGMTSDEYKEDAGGGGMGKRTGRTIRAGQKAVPFMADVIVRTAKDGGVFSTTIEKGWRNAESEGATLKGKASKWARVMAMTTGTDEDEWMTERRA
jgi:hypothetical protein